MLRKDLGLRSLVNLEEWQKIQDSFSEVLEVTLRTISSNGKLLSRVSRPTRLCDKVLPDNPFYSDFCGSCVSKIDIKNLTGIKEEASFKCSFGLDLFVVPITGVGNRIIAHIILGPVILNRRKNSSEYAKEAEKLGIKLEELMDTLIEIKVFSYNKIYSISKLLGDVFSHMVQTGYHKKRLGEMAPEIMEMDPLFLRYYEEKILNSMLNACMLALDTDSGSVMTLDRKTHMLHIKAAAKLDEDIVQNTNIKVGEGIAGVVAATAEPVILPKDVNKNGLSGRMKRRYIKSSMIVPFPKEKNHDVYGVINLNMIRKNINFSKKDIAFVQELINLASIALVPFSQTSLSKQILDKNNNL
jgi:ligand-binding sensor protein